MNAPGETPEDRQLWTGYLVAPAATTSESAIPIAAMLRSAVRGWRYWLVTGVLGGAAGIAIALSLTPIYRSTAVVAIESQGADSLGSGLLGGQLSGLAGLAGLSLGGANRRMEYIAVLESRALGDQFIAENNLTVQFFREDWDAQTQRWTTKKPPTAGDAYDYFSDHVRSIDEDRRTGLVTVSMEWRDREAAARWANEYVKRANDLLRARAMREAKSSLEFLDVELGKASTVEIRNAMYQLVEAQKKQQMLATVREDYIFRIIDQAVTSDREAFVRPKRALIAIACGFAGGLLGIGIALYRDRRSFIALEQK